MSSFKEGKYLYLYDIVFSVTKDTFRYSQNFGKRLYELKMIAMYCFPGCLEN